MKNFKSVLKLLLILGGFCQFANPVIGQSDAALTVAMDHLAEQREALELTSDDIRNYIVNDHYSSKHNGVTHIYLNQTHQDIRILNAIININVLPTGKVLNMGNRFVADVANRASSAVPGISPAIAVGKVMEAFSIAGDAPERHMAQVSNTYFLFDHTGIALEPIKVKLVYEEQDDKSVRLVWMVEFYQMDAQHWWNARIDAQSGTMLKYRDQVIHCEFNGPTGLCLTDGHQHQAVKNNPKVSAVEPYEQLGPVYQNVMANSYHVFPFPVFSPDHGSPALVTNPADFIASPFGWHDIDGADGAEYTITRGNNVHAYHDIFAINSSSDDEPDGGPDLDFNFPLDLNSEFPYTQVEPAVVNLFYWNNVIHDLWYHYGFDEVSGNFQVNNYGNGGQDGDYVRAEALDGTGTDNANFGTGEDGSGARMQMYIWTNESLPDFEIPTDFIVSDPALVTGVYQMVSGGFGGSLPSDSIVSEVVIVDDGVGTGSDACEELINGADLMGKVAMIDRGDCEFGAKMLKAQNEGAIAVIMCNNVADAPIQMGGGAVGDQVSIPGIMISMADCATIRVGVPDLQVKLYGPDFQIPTPGPNGRDGDFDNGIVVHEYGHGISIRLTGGPSTGNCLGSPEQAGEGWSDWFALVMSTDASNNGAQSRPMGTFAQGAPTTANGIREFPYTTNMAINPHTYGDVPSLIAPHGVGSAWCAMIWDMYWALVEEHGFNEDQYNGDGGNNIAMQLVIDGLKLQSCNPSFVDSRDGILAADEANYGGENACLIWEVFARRGLGFSASAGGNEAFDTPPFCTPLQISKTADIQVAADGEITYTIEISNLGESALANATVSDEFPAGTTYVEGSLTCGSATVSGSTLTIDAGELAVAGTITCSYRLKVDATPFSVVGFEDGVEDGTENWTVSNDPGTAAWEASTNSAFSGSTSWFAENVGSSSDQYLTISSPLEISGGSPTLSFIHSYNTQNSEDGGVVEISTNEGATWIDLAPFFTNNGYDGKLAVDASNALASRAAFHGNSNGYIQSTAVLGAFTGKDLLVRFRFATGAGGSGEGWYVDNIQFFTDYHSVKNVACANATDQEEFCTEAVTTVLGELDTKTDDLSDLINISLSPNPTDGLFQLTVNGQKNESAAISILSVDGKLMQSRFLPQLNGTFDFDLSGYEAGVYLIRLRQDDGVVVKKVILQ